MEFSVYDLGLVDYSKACAFQKETFEKVKLGILSSALIFCRHNPVITLGRSARRKNILVPEPKLETKGIKVIPVERGGDITYHGPGQLMVYPVFNLAHLRKDIHWFLRELEEAVIGALSEYGIRAQQRPGLTGVWVGKAKIASIGIAIKNWITFHGISINIKSDDLKNYKLIRPCGMDIEMISIESLINREVDINFFQEIIVNHLQKRGRQHDESNLAVFRRGN